MKLKCLIVDDEPPAHKVLENYISKVNFLELSGNCHNAIEALNFIREQKVDVLFLDINMPELTGLEMLGTLSDPPIVILTTAYSEFALEGFDLGVFDYLLKPIRFGRFLKAVNRIPKPEKLEASQSQEVIKEDAFFFAKANGIQHKIIYSEIDFVESKGNFVHLNMAKKLLIASTLTKMNEKLSPHGFMRVHKSYIVNLEKVEAIVGNQLIIKDYKIPIGNSYRQIVLGKIGI